MIISEQTDEIEDSEDVFQRHRSGVKLLTSRAKMAAGGRELSSPSAIPLPGCSNSCLGTASVSMNSNFENEKDDLKNNIPSLSSKRSLMKLLMRRFPISKWIFQYTKGTLYYDFIAGITVGLMLVPQSLAYSTLAGLPPEYGLYASYWGAFLYCLFGTSKDISVGPVALVCILIDKYTQHHEDNITVATTLALFSGLVLIGMALMKLQILISFISLPVLSGFTSAAAIKIALTQLKGVLGLRIPRGNFFQTVYNFFKHIKKARMGDSIMSITCLILFITLRKVSKWNNKRKIPDDAPLRTRICSKILWFLCTARFTWVTFLTTIIAQVMYEQFGKKDAFLLAGHMVGGLPSATVPLRDVEQNGKTITKLEILQELSTGFIVTPLVAFLETIAVAKTLARKGNYKVDVTQELFALGIVNVVGSFFWSFPVAGSFSRSALNSQIGVKTPIGGVFTGIVVILALSFLTPWFRFIPKATLSAMVIAAVIPLFEYKMVGRLWHTKRIDLIPMAVAFFFCFYETEVGILAGVAVALLILIYQNIQLRISIEPQDDVCLVKLESQYVYYPSAEQLISKIEKMTSSKKNPPKVVILDFENVLKIDSTTATLLKQFWLAMKAKIVGTTLAFRNLNEEISGILTKIGIDINSEVQNQECLETSPVLFVSAC